MTGAKTQVKDRMPVNCTFFLSKERRKPARSTALTTDYISANTSTKTETLNNLMGGGGGAGTGRRWGG